MLCEWPEYRCSNEVSHVVQWDHKAKEPKQFADKQKTGLCRVHFRAVKFLMKYFNPDKDIEVSEEAGH